MNLQKATRNFPLLARAIVAAVATGKAKFRSSVRRDTRLLSYDTRAVQGTGELTAIAPTRVGRRKPGWNCSVHWHHCDHAAFAPLGENFTAA